MQMMTPTMARACDIAAAFVKREVAKRRRLNANCTSREIWAGVTPDGRIFIGTPLLDQGQGFYVDARGRLELA